MLYAWACGVKEESEKGIGYLVVLRGTVPLARFFPFTMTETKSESCACPGGSLIGAALAIWEKVIAVSIKRDTSPGP